jgi:diguanylate cyclase (GGDEF)-like protein/PAS domain S-box-containing protein
MLRATTKTARDNLIYLGQIAALAGVYVLVAKLGLALSVVGQNVTLIWPPTGVSLAALLLGGYRLWPGVALGALVATASTGLSWPGVLGVALGNTLEALCGAYFLNRATDNAFSLSRVKDVLILIGGSAGVSTMLSATLGTVSLCLVGSVPWTHFVGTWAIWWMGDAMGDLVFAPVLLAPMMPKRASRMHWRTIEAILLVAIQVASGVLVFGSWISTLYGGAFLTFPTVVWGALRFGPAGAATTALIASLTALWGTITGLGPFSGYSPIESLTLLWLYANVMAITSLVLAASLSERKRALADFQLAAKVFEHTAESILITDASQRILLVNKAFTEQTGYAPEDVIGQTPRVLNSGRQDAAFYRSMWDSIATEGHWRGEIWDRRKSGDVYPAWLTVNAVHAERGETTNYIAISSDMSERKEIEAHVRHLAQHDALTNLPNRLVLQDRIEDALAVAERRGSLVAILFVDLDRFKAINDTLGHAIGDELLEGVAKRLIESVRTDDTVARLGGDEFVIVLSAVAHTDDAINVAQKVIANISGTVFYARGHELHVSASIGISTYPRDGRDAQTLMKNADTAMYHAKRAGGTTSRLYAAGMNATAMERMALENSLRHAVQHGDFVLHYQPQVDIATRRPTGLEALVRWQHPEHGLIAPDKFIPIAEETGLIVSIGEWVLREACAQAQRWRVAGARGFRVAVNISARQFWRGNLLETVLRVLDETGAAPDMLEFELTESTLMRDEAESTSLLAQMNELGIRISVDDFGTGYSSLSYLNRFPIHRLKIDQSFIRDICDHSDDAAIATAILAMARSLNLGAIAEGVETQQQLDFLHRLGCQEAQGYLLGRPQLPAALADIVVADPLRPDLYPTASVGK